MQNEPLHRWLAWFDGSSPPELIAEIVGTDEAIKAAEERMVYVTGDDEAIRAYEMRQMALSDLTSYKNFAREEGLAEGKAEGLAEGRAEGRAEGLVEGHKQGLAEGRVQGLTEGRAAGKAEGRAEGLAQANLEIARKMKAMSISTAQIQDITGLLPETIEML